MDSQPTFNFKREHRIDFTFFLILLKKTEHRDEDKPQLTSIFSVNDATGQGEDCHTPTGYY